jgi:hypothetical protein
VGCARGFLQDAHQSRSSLTVEPKLQRGVREVPMDWCTASCLRLSAR